MNSNHIRTTRCWLFVDTVAQLRNLIIKLYVASDQSCIRNSKHQYNASNWCMLCNSDNYLGCVFAMHHHVWSDSKTVLAYHWASWGKANVDSFITCVAISRLLPKVDVCTARKAEIPFVTVALFDLCEMPLVKREGLYVTHNLPPGHPVPCPKPFCMSTLREPIIVTPIPRTLMILDY